MLLRITLSCALLSGCATLERHPVATAIGLSIVAGSIAASANHHGGSSHDVGVGDPNCYGNPRMCE